MGALYHMSPASGPSEGTSHFSLSGGEGWETKAVPWVGPTARMGMSSE